MRGDSVTMKAKTGEKGRPSLKMEGKRKKSEVNDETGARLFVDSLLLVNRQQHTAHVQFTLPVHASLTRFLTSVDQMLISLFSEARNRPSGENDSDHTKPECFSGRIRFCFVSSFSNGFQMTIRPSPNPLI